MRIGLLTTALVCSFNVWSAGAQPTVTRSVPQSMAQVQMSYGPVVRKTAPAVVNIYSKRKIRSPFADDPFFGRFFSGRERTQGSLGSGVIVRSDGVIVTNNHVIDRADEIVVVLADRREFEAKVLLADEQSDLAVLKVNTAGKLLPTLAFHNSDNAEVGDIVLAIGNPFGVGQTVTSGIISALARTRAGVNDYQFFLQTDAAINPGNSGGALVTMDGALIGINTAIYSRSGGSIGIGFAIPSNMVKTVVATAVSGGKAIARPWLGFRGQSVTAGIAESMGLERPVGLLVNDVYPSGPASQAGLRSGDVVIKADEFEVNDEQSLNFRATTKGVGADVVLTYLRQGQLRTATLRLVKAPETSPRDITEIDGRNPFSGTTVANLSPAFAEELGVFETNGVIIVELSGRSLARRLGFAAGDIITSVNGRKITSVDVLQSVLKSSPRGWKVIVKRGGETLTLSVGG